MHKLLCAVPRSPDSSLFNLTLGWGLSKFLMFLIFCSISICSFYTNFLVSLGIAPCDKLMFIGKDRNLKFIYITTKTRRFRISVGYLISNEKILMFIKPASLMQKRRVFVVM